MLPNVPPTATESERVRPAEYSLVSSSRSAFIPSPRTVPMAPFMRPAACTARLGGRGLVPAPKRPTAETASHDGRNPGRPHRDLESAHVHGQLHYRAQHLSDGDNAKDQSGDNHVILRHRHLHFSDANRSGFAAPDPVRRSACSATISNALSAYILPALLLDAFQMDAPSFGFLRFPGFATRTTEDGMSIDIALGDLVPPLLPIGRPNFRRATLATDDSAVHIEFG